MRRRVLTLLATLGAATLVAVPALGIQFGTPDTTNEYSGVGLVVFYDGAPADDGDGIYFSGYGNPLWRCTGALISSRELLTAGHCAEDFTAKYAAVWFSPGPVDFAPATGYPNPAFADARGTPDSHPSWNGLLTVPNTSDVGMVHLRKAVRGKDVYTVAPEGYLQKLATRRGLQDELFTVVGYGAQAVRPFPTSVRQRHVATVKLITLASALTGGYSVEYTSDPGAAHAGGICFGDSGGPLFHGTGARRVIVAVNSFVLNENCRGTGFGYRVDTDYAQDFIFPPGD